MRFQSFSEFEGFGETAAAAVGGGAPSWQTGLGAWFDATGADTSIWSDISGNGFHVQQATAGSRPTIDAAAKNGRQARGFTTGRSLARSAVIGTTDYSFAMVVNTQAHTLTQTYLRNGAGSTGYRYDYRQSPAFQDNLVHSGVADVISLATGSGWKIVTATRRTAGGNAVNMWVNGGQVVTNATTAMNAPATTFTVGGSNNIGQIGEIIVAAREWSLAEVAEVIEFLNTGWAIYTP